MKPRKAQVKDKGLGAKSWDFGLKALKFLEPQPENLGLTLKFEQIEAFAGNPQG